MTKTQESPTVDVLKNYNLSLSGDTIQTIYEVLEKSRELTPEALDLLGTTHMGVESAFNWFSRELGGVGYQFPNTKRFDSVTAEVHIPDESTGRVAV